MLKTSGKDCMAGLTNVGGNWYRDIKSSLLLTAWGPIAFDPVYDPTLPALSSAPLSLAHATSWPFATDLGERVGLH